jgi:hypothetical protein
VYFEGLLKPLPVRASELSKTRETFDRCRAFKVLEQVRELIKYCRAFGKGCVYRLGCEPPVSVMLHVEVLKHNTDLRAKALRQKLPDPLHLPAEAQLGVATIDDCGQRCVAIAEHDVIVVHGNGRLFLREGLCRLQQWIDCSRLRSGHCYGGSHGLNGRLNGWRFCAASAYTNQQPLGKTSSDAELQ